MYFDIKSSDLREPVGFAIDIGGSCAKIAYIDEKHKDNSSTARVRFETFSRDDIKSIADFIKCKCSNVGDNTAGESSPVEVYAAGFGAAQHRKQLEALLNIRLIIKNELDGFAQATKYMLRNQPRKTTFSPTPAGVRDEVQHMLEAFAESPFTKLGDENIKDETKKVVVGNLNLADASEKDDCFPCLMCMCGSGTGMYTMDKDGKFLLCNGTITGGRWFVNLCKLILGTDDFEEIIALAEKGDQRNVDLFGDDVKLNISSDDSETKIYTSFPDDIVMFFMGKVADYDGMDFSSFKKEDLAASLLQSQCFNISQLTELVVKEKGMNKVLFSGGFFTHPYVARCMEQAFLGRLHFGTSEETTRYGFMRYGSCYGALGLLLKQD